VRPVSTGAGGDAGRCALPAADAIVRKVSTDSLEQTTDDYVAVFSALSEPLRVRIVHMLAHRSDGELPCATLDAELPVGKSTISYHVGILRRAGLITVRKEGRNYFYRLREENLSRFAADFLAHLRNVEILAVSPV
jgi:DNA-binding transcriptional ArsR family regulator